MRRFMLVAMASSAASIAFAAFDGTTVESEPVLFRAYVTGGAPYALVGVSDVTAWPITWKSGEIVTATATQDGLEYTIADSATVATSAPLPAQKGGVWKLYNSAEGSATICIPWSASEIGGVLGTGMSDFVADTAKDGPNRRVRTSPPSLVAFSGDDWTGDVSKAATVTFTPPADSGLEAVTWNDLAGGNGARSFKFSAAGTWTVLLTFADGTTQTSLIEVYNAGLMILFR